MQLRHQFITIKEIDTVRDSLWMGIGHREATMFIPRRLKRCLGFNGTCQTKQGLKEYPFPMNMASLNSEITHIKVI